MKLTLVGSRYFGATVFEALVKDGVEIVQVVAPAADDRLALAAKAKDVPVHVLQGGSDPIVYERVTRQAVDRLCAAGDTVQYDVVAGVDHGVLTPERTMPWIEARFSGAEAPGNCP